MKSADAFDLLLSELGVNAKSSPDWVRNEFEIFLVKVSLGGGAAVEAVTSLTDKLLGLTEASRLFEACLTIEEAPKLQQLAERIVLTWMFESAQGRPLDHRLYPLIAEWCQRRINPAGAGRPQDSPIKSLTVASRLVELAANYPPKAYGAKKQIYGTLETQFKLKRSQLSKLIKGLDPWEFIKSKASGKSD